MFKFRKKSHQEVLDNIPNHIGIIMMEMAVGLKSVYNRV